MRVPTTGETFSKLMHHVRLAQEDAAMMAHLNRDDHGELALMWLAVSENLKKMQHQLTQLAQGKLQ